MNRHTISTILVTLAVILNAALVSSPGQALAAGKKGDPPIPAGHPGRPVSPNLLPPPSPSGNWYGSSAAGSGAAPWESFTPIDLGAGIGLAVNNVNKNLMVTVPTVSVPGVNGLDETIDLTWNSLSHNVGEVAGNGWVMSLGRDVGLFIGSSSITFYDESGHGWNFNEPSSCSFTSPPGTDASLACSSSGYILTDHASAFQYQFNSHGYLTAEQNRAGNHLTFGYNSGGYIVSSITNTEGQTTTLSYDGGNNLTQIQDPVGHTWTFAHDSAGDLTSVTDAGSHVTKFSYDSSYNLTQITDPNGNATQLSYDSNSAVTKIVQVTNSTTNAGPTWSFGAGSPQLVNNGGFEDGQSPWSEHSVNGYEVITTNRPHSGSYGAWLCGYNNCNDQVWQTLTLPSSFSKLALSYWYYSDTQETVSTCYDNFVAQLRTSSGTPITTATSLCNVNATNGWVQETADVTAALSSYAGQQVQIYFQGTSNASNASDFFVDDVTLTASSPSTAVTDPNGHVTTYAYDGSDRVTSVTAPDNTTTQISWTGDNQVASAKLPSGANATYTYDANNNVTQITQPTGATEKAVYGNSSFPYLPSSATDAQGNTTTFAYNARGLLSSSTDALNHTSSLSYNSNGTVASGTDENGHVTSFGYTTSGLPNSTTAPAPLGSTAATYNSADLVATSTDGKGQSASDSYDALGQLTGLSCADGSSIGYAYDANGNVVSETDSTGTTTYSYDALNQLTQEKLPNGNTVTYTYDPAGNLLSKADGGGTVTYSYDVNDRLTGVTEPSGAKTSFAYDVDGNQTGLSYPNGVTEHQSYLNSTELSRIWATGSSGSTLDSFGYSYTNPANNQPTAQRYSMKDAAANTTNYAYDALNRLTGATTKNSGGVQTASYSYAYDPVGNLTSENRNGVSASLAYNNADELTSAGSSSATSDANGNQLSASGRLAASYDAQDQTVGLVGPGGQGMIAGYTGTGQSGRVVAGAPSFQYDALGLASLATSGASISSAARSSSISVKDQPSTFATGGTATEQVTLRNTGSQTWPAGGSNPVHLAVHFASKGGGYGVSGTESTWATNQRISLPNDVGPGASVTIPVTLTIPSTSGSYVLESQLVQESVAWFPQYFDSPVSVSTGALAASIVVSSQPSSFSVGGSASYQVTLTNNGTQTWPAGGSNPVHLGVHFSSQGGGYGTSGTDNTWATNQRFSLPNDVAPGASVTFSMTVTAPGTAGNYVLEYQPGQEGVTWFSQYLDSQAAVGTGNPAFPAGTTYFTTTPDGQVLSERLPNGSGGFTSYYYLHDGLGSVVGLTDSTGAVVNSYAYDPYGNTTSVSEQVANPFRYIGAIYDSSTGLSKMGERYYDPTTGRFTQQDPLGGGYQYVGDNPINEIDPSGQFGIPTFVTDAIHSIKNEWFWVEKNQFKLDGKIAERWHFHLDPWRNSTELRKWHLPYQWRQWMHNFRSIANRRFKQWGSGKFERWVQSVDRQLEKIGRDMPPPEDLGE